VKDITTYVGVDAHQKDLFIAMLIGPPGLHALRVAPVALAGESAKPPSNEGA
jgi:hypothetical protein